MASKRFIQAVVLLGLMPAARAGAEPAPGEGVLVFEVEDWTEPKSAWRENADAPDRWNLWTAEPEVDRKRSRGGSLRSPTVVADRASPEEGAPVLHTRITGIPTGLYRVSLSDPGRTMAWSLDGRAWNRAPGGREVALGVFEITDGVFELRVDDRYATPERVGPWYYDTIRMEPFRPPVFSHLAVFDAPDGRTQISWITSEAMDTGRVEIRRGGRWESLAAGDVRNVRNHRVWVERGQLERPAEIRVCVPMGPSFTATSAAQAIPAPAAGPAEGGADMEIPLHVPEALSPDRCVVGGIAFGPGALRGTGGGAVRCGPDAVPSQAAVAARWPDGSVKWLTVRFLPRGGRPEACRWTSGSSAAVESALRVVSEGDGLRIGNGRLQVRVSPGHPLPWTDVRSFDGVPLAVPTARPAWLVPGDGAEDLRPGPADVLVVQEQGPAEVVVLAEGPFTAADGSRRFRYRLRWRLAAGSSLLEIAFTLINDRMDAEFSSIRSLGLTVCPAGSGPARCVLAGQAGTVLQPGESCELRQVDDRRVRRTTPAGARSEEERCLGWAVLERGPARLAAAMQDFWQTWPRAISASTAGLSLHLLPPAPDDCRPADARDWAVRCHWQADGAYAFKRGMSFRSDFGLRFDPAGSETPAGGWAEWARRLQGPSCAAPLPARLCAAGVFGPIEPAGEATAAYDAVVAADHAGVLRGWEQDRAYGWMNYGDWFGERAFNWGNNEYDLAWSMAHHFARTGRWDYFVLGLEMARHYATIDAIHVPWQPEMSGRVYTHSFGHVGMDERRPAPAWDDPAWKQYIGSPWPFHRGLIDAGGHIYIEGLFAYYFLTGDRDFLEAGEMIAGAQAAWLTRKFDFGIERAAGWPLSNAVAAWEATGNPFYLNAARLYVERILAKQDPDQGCWLLPQDRSECDHPPPHLGSKSFATGVLLYAMMRYDLIEPRADVRQSIVRACGWLVERAWNREKGGFRYKTGCDRYADSADTGGTQALVLPGLAYGWKLSGDRRFLELARTCLAGCDRWHSGLGKGATMATRQSAFALPILREADRTAAAGR